MNFNSLKYFISGIYPPHIWFSLLLFLRCKNKQKIREDVKQWVIHCHMRDMNFMHTLSHLLIFEKPFRNIFYRRIGTIGKILTVLMPGEKTLFITPHEIEGGFFIRHGYATFVNTKRIGKNCILHQCTTIGDNGKGGIPSIGDNVTIGTGAIILGDITIGNNVTIAAGAIVVFNVPDNSVVIGDKARIYKKNNNEN